MEKRKETRVNSSITVGSADRFLLGAPNILPFVNLNFPSTLREMEKKNWKTGEMENWKNGEGKMENWRNGKLEMEKQKNEVNDPSTFLVNPLTFNGPCKSEYIYFQIIGTIKAPSLPESWDGRDASQWLAFRGVNGLKVEGGGIIDGQGKKWWDQSCRYHPDLKGCTKLAPTAMKVLSCNNSSVSNIQFSSSPQTHALIFGCNGFNVSHVSVESPGDSPNTDGIHIHASHHLSITYSNISCGDDCISIGDYTSNIEINNVQCGPGHGISIGSLGKSGNFVQVEDIHVYNCTFNGTTNGARIKTWQTGRGYVRNVTFENLQLFSVDNPIIIDQNYCDVRGACKELASGVEISDVVYQNISGTASRETAINLNCSRSVACTGIRMESIDITAQAASGTVAAYCSNARGQESVVEPGPCLQQL